MYGNKWRMVCSCFLLMVIILILKRFIPRPEFALVGLISSVMFGFSLSREVMRVIKFKDMRGDYGGEITTGPMLYFIVTSVSFPICLLSIVGFIYMYMRL